VKRRSVNHVSDGAKSNIPNNPMSNIPSACKLKLLLELSELAAEFQRRKEDLQGAAAVMLEKQRKVDALLAELRKAILE
jgi:hypothetical protein